MAEELGGGDVLAGDAAVGGTHLADDHGVLVLADEEGIEERAVLEGDAEDAVAGFDGGVGGEDVADDGLRAHGTDGAEVRADGAAGAADLVAGGAEGGEGFSGHGIAGGFGEGEVVLVFFVEGFCLRLAHDGRRIERADQCSIGCGFGPALLVGAVEEKGSFACGDAAVEVGADFRAAALAAPDAVFGELALGAAFLGAPADAESRDIVGHGFGFGVVELAVDVDFKCAGGIAGDGDVSPEVGGDFLFGDDGVSPLATAVDAERFTGEVDVEQFGCAAEAVVVVDAGAEPDPCLDGESSLEVDLGGEEGVVLAVELEDGAEFVAELGEEFSKFRVVAEDGLHAVERDGAEVIGLERLGEAGGDEGGGSAFVRAEDLNDLGAELGGDFGQAGYGGGFGILHTGVRKGAEGGEPEFLIVILQQCGKGNRVGVLLGGEGIERGDAERVFRGIEGDLVEAVRRLFQAEGGAEFHPAPEVVGAALEELIDGFRDERLDALRRDAALVGEQGVDDCLAGCGVLELGFQDFGDAGLIDGLREQQDFLRVRHAVQFPESRGDERCGLRGRQGEGA